MCLLHLQIQSNTFMDVDLCNQYCRLAEFTYDFLYLGLLYRVHSSSQFTISLQVGTRNPFFLFWTNKVTAVTLEVCCLQLANVNFREFFWIFFSYTWTKVTSRKVRFSCVYTEFSSKFSFNSSRSFNFFLSLHYL